MEQRIDRLYPNTQLEKDCFGERLERKSNDFIVLIIQIITSNKIILFFKDKDHKSKMKYEKYKTLASIIESVDTIVINGSTATSVTLSITGIGSIILPITAGMGCSISIANKVLHKININKYNKNKKQYEKDQQTIKPFEKI